MNAVGRWFRVPGRRAHFVTVETPYHLYTLCGRCMERSSARAVETSNKCKRCDRLLQRALAHWDRSFVADIAEFEHNRQNRKE